MSELGKGKISADALKNPFEDIQKKGQEYSVKYCAWEVLKDYCQGLNVTQIAKEIQERGLKDFSEKKNAAGQVSGDLVRGKGVFWHDPERKLWWIRPLAPIFKGSRSKAYGSPATRNKKNCSGKGTTNGSSLVGLRVTVWWDGEKSFFDGRIDAYDELRNRFRIVYDDGDADEAMAFHKYVIISKEGQLDAVKVLEHNLDDNDIIPGSHEVAAGDPNSDMLHFQSLRIAGDSNNLPTNDWKSPSKKMDSDNPVLDHQGNTLPNFSNSVQSPQKEEIQHAVTDRVEPIPKTPKKKAARAALEKSRTKRTGKPGRPPKRPKTHGDSDARNHKRLKPFTQEGESEGLLLEDGPQLEHVPPEDSKDCIAVSNLLETEMREPAREAAGSTCENNILCNADEKKVEEEIDVCPALVEESQNHVEGSMFDVSTPVASRQAPSGASNEANPTESEAIKADEASGCVILRRKRSVMNRKGLQPGSSRVWGGSSLESRSNTGDENQTQFDVADRSHNTSSQPSYKASKSPGSGKSSRCASPESISCTMPNGGGKSIGGKQSAHAKESTLLQLLTKDLNKNLERGASIDMLDLTKGLFTNPRVMEPPLGQLGNVGELMSLSQLSEELKPKQEELESQREAEVTSALLGEEVPTTFDESNANPTDLEPDEAGSHQPEQDPKVHQKSQLPEDCDGQMDNLHLEDDPFSQKVTCSQQDGVNCGPVSITVEDDLQPRASNYPIQGSAGNSAQGKTGSITEEAKRTQFDPGLGVIAGPSLVPCKVSNPESRESTANFDVGNNPSQGTTRKPGVDSFAQEHTKMESGGTCTLSGDINKPSQRDSSHPRRSFPPMPVGVLKWSSPLLQTSNLKLPCPIDESVSNMKNMSESGCRPG